MVHKSLTIGVLAALALCCGQATIAHADDPAVATAQAADRQAQQAGWQLQSARSTADAAYARATANAVATADAARATQTAQAMQVTATAVQATQEAQATRQALEVEATRQAIHAQATTAAHQHQAVATAQAQALQATAQTQATIAELDRLSIERGRFIQPLYTVGPWLVFGALILVAGALVYRAARPGVAVTETDVIEGSYYPAPPPTGPVALLPAQAGERPCILRPIARGQSKRPPAVKIEVE